MVGEPFEGQLKAVDIPRAGQWALVGGELPLGLVMKDTGAIAGKPYKEGPVTFTVQYAGADGKKSGPHSVSLTIYPRLKITGDVSRRSDLPQPGEDFIADLHAEGGVPPYEWRLARGSALPDGLDLSSGGRIDGIPRAQGKSPFTVQVEDHTSRTATANFVVKVARPWLLLRRRTKIGACSITVRASWRDRLFHVGNWLGFLAIGFPTFGTIWIFAYAFSTSGDHWNFLGVGMLTALAAFLVGCLAGFLFGIPRVLSSGQLRQQAGTTGYVPSSNLAEVSDWLTKLLLGAGLVQLTHLGAPIASLIDHVAGGLHGPAGSSQAATVMAGAILVGFTTVGLLDSYVVTTMWYQDHLIKHSLQ
jgi:Putative Ig domain